MLKKGSDGRHARYIQRHHRRWRVLDQRHRLCHGQRRQRRGDRRVAVSRARGRPARRIEGARARHRARRRRRHQAREHTVKGATEWAHAERAARTIANSLLVKTAIHGGDPNWGRLVAAAGRSGVPFDLSRAAVHIGGIVLFENGQPHDANARRRRPTCRARTSTSRSTWAPAGTEQATIWTCDLSADYVRINADYRT